MPLVWKTSVHLRSIIVNCLILTADPGVTRSILARDPYFRGD